MSYYLVLVYTISKHKTEQAAKKELKKLRFGSDDVAMVVEMPEDVKLKLPTYKTKGKHK